MGKSVRYSVAYISYGTVHVPPIIGCRKKKHFKKERARKRIEKKRRVNKRESVGVRKEREREGEREVQIVTDGERESK